MGPQDAQIHQQKIDEKDQLRDRLRASKLANETTKLQKKNQKRGGKKKRRKKTKKETLTSRVCTTVVFIFMWDSHHGISRLQFTGTEIVLSFHKIISKYTSVGS